jgi:hypothetical protein
MIFLLEDKELKVALYFDNNIFIIQLSKSNAFCLLTFLINKYSLRFGSGIL